MVLRDDALEVEVLETCPAPDAVVTMTLTQPVEVAGVSVFRANCSLTSVHPDGHARSRRL